MSFIVSFWEGEEELLKIHSLMFVTTGRLLQSILADLNEGSFNQILVSRLKPKLSVLLKLFIERSNIDKLLELKDSEPSQKTSIYELNRLSDEALENIKLEEIERPYFISILVTLLNLNNHVELDDVTKKNLLNIAVKAGVIQYSVIDNNQRKLLDEAIQSGSLT